MIIKQFDYSNELKVVVNECSGPVEYSVLEQNYINLMRLEKLIEDFDKTPIAFEMGKVIVTGKLTQTITPYVLFDIDCSLQKSNRDYHAARYFKEFLQRNDSSDLVKYVFSAAEES